MWHPSQFWTDGKQEKMCVSLCVFGARGSRFFLWLLTESQTVSLLTNGTVVRWVDVNHNNTEQANHDSLIKHLMTCLPCNQPAAEGFTHQNWLFGGGCCRWRRMVVMRLVHSHPDNNYSMTVVKLGISQSRLISTDSIGPS